MQHDDACLPEALRGPSTTITRVGAGLSGAGVYRVEAGGEVYVLKVAAGDEPVDAWRRRVEILRLAAGAGLAPPVVHVDEARRAVVSAFVVDRSFPALLGDPRTRDAAIELLGTTLRRIHDLPMPPDVEAKETRDYLATVTSGAGVGVAVPAFVDDAVAGALVEVPPPRDRAFALCHNDVNPTNLVYDGERLLLLDWDTAGVNDPFHDLAAIAVFLRMDADTCRRLIAAHDGAPPVAALPARFDYARRLVAVLCGVMFLRLAREGGHPGATGAETLASTPSLADFYQRLRAGAVSIATAEGKWEFGLALVKESVALLRTA